MYKMGLSVGDWLDNPIYWVQNMYRKYQWGNHIWLRLMNHLIILK
jgi:hypothetical protein